MVQVITIKIFIKGKLDLNTFSVWHYYCDVLLTSEIIMLKKRKT